MCAHPYDYCGPTFDAPRDDCSGDGACGDCGPCCDPLARAGSILSPPLDTVVVDVPNSAAPAAGTDSDTAILVEEGPLFDRLPHEPAMMPGHEGQALRGTRMPQRMPRPIR